MRLWPIETSHTARQTDCCGGSGGDADVLLAHLLLLLMLSNLFQLS